MASRRRLRRLLAVWRGPAAAACDGKQGYARRTDAEAAAGEIQRRKRLEGDPVPLRVYACPHCARWHVGHVPARLQRLLDGTGAERWRRLEEVAGRPW